MKVKDGHKEVKIKGRAIEWLNNINIKHRNDKTADKPFIKVLLISVFTVKFIKSGDKFEEDLIKFIKGSLKKKTLFENIKSHVIEFLFILELFFHRTGDDIERQSSFETLVPIATDEIRK